MRFNSFKTEAFIADFRWELQEAFDSHQLDQGLVDRLRARDSYYEVPESVWITEIRDYFRERAGR